LFSAAQILECEFAPPCYRGGPHLGQLLHFFCLGDFFLLYFASSYNYYFSEYCFSLPCGFFLGIMILNFHFVSCGIRSAFLLLLSLLLAVYRFPFFSFSVPWRICSVRWSIRTRTFGWAIRRFPASAVFYRRCLRRRFRRPLSRSVLNPDPG